MAGFELCSHAPNALHSNADANAHTDAYTYAHANAAIRLPDLSLSAGSG